MPVTIKFNPQNNNIQAEIIQDATPNNDGVMTKEQAAELAALVAGGGGGSGKTFFTVLSSAVDAAVDYSQLMEADPTGGHIDINLPAPSSASTAVGNVFIIKNIAAVNTVGLRRPVGTGIDGPVSLAPGQWAMYISDGLSNYICVSTNFGELVVTDVKTAAYNAQPYDVVQGDSTAGDIPVNLPAAASSVDVQIYVKSVGTANLVNITPTGGDTVEGAALLALAPGESAILISDGVSNWMQF